MITPFLKANESSFINSDISTCKNCSKSWFFSSKLLMKRARSSRLSTNAKNAFMESL